jgi:hypothetical protein
MRSAHRLPLLAAAVVSSWTLPARAQLTESLSSATAVVTPEREPLFGVMMDAGVPDGANASLVFRPLSWLRAHGGGGTNVVSRGVRIGATLLPFGGGPSATFEAGHYFEGDANGLAQRFAGVAFSSPLLERVGYDYANAHLGLDFGSHRAVFYIHGGMSYIRATIHNVDSAVASEASANGANAGADASIKTDQVVKGWVPSAKLGLIVYFW